MLIALYYAVGLWGYVFTPDPYGIPLVWPATGVGLAFTYLYGYRMLPALGIATGLILWQFTEDAMPLVEATGVVLATMAGVGLGAWALRRFGFSPGFERLRDVLLLLVVGALAASGLAATAGAWAMAVSIEELGFSDTWWLCWVADLIGFLLVTPALIAWLAAGRRHLDSGLPMIVLLAASLIGVSALVYSGVLETGLAMPLSYAVFPLVMLAALRCPIQITTSLILIVGAIALSGTGWGLGPFADAGLEQSLLSLNAQLALLVLTGLLLAALRNERESAEARGRQHLDDLARAGRLSTLGELSASLAHELNQPLCAVTSYASASRRLLDRERLDDLRDALTQLDSNAHRAAETIRQVRATAMSETPRQVAMAPRDLITPVLELLDPELKRRRVRIDVDVARSLPHIRVAPVQIEQVLVNLLRNAMEAVETRLDGTIRVAARNLGTALEITVTDNGPGIPEERLATLFDPFATWKSGGIGLGLPISRSLVEAHGGQLTATNLDDGGARFRFTLPLEVPDARSQTPAGLSGRR
ncbi:MAG: histidine kinase [Thioalkalivibrio sp.]|nr:MAG: histidine kinase [Thioalkalivibrio sp.]